MVAFSQGIILISLLLGQVGVGYLRFLLLHTLLHDLSIMLELSQSIVGGDWLIRRVIRDALHFFFYVIVHVYNLLSKVRKSKC